MVYITAKHIQVAIFIKIYAVVASIRVKIQFLKQKGDKENRKQNKSWIIYEIIQLIE